MDVPSRVTKTRKGTGRPVTLTKGQLEAEISSALVAFEKEHMGRGPLEARTRILQDIVLVRLTGVLTPAEKHLAVDDEGIHLIKQVRTKLLENAQRMLLDMIRGLTGIPPVSLHTDISTRTGERFIIFTLARDLESALACTGQAPGLDPGPT